MLPEFKPEDYPDKTCCGVLEHLIASGYKFPFSKPVVVKRDTMQMDTGGWAVTMYEQDARTLGLNQRKHITVFLTHCPFCGKKIGE